MIRGCTDPYNNLIDRIADGNPIDVTGKQSARRFSRNTTEPKQETAMKTAKNPTRSTASLFAVAWKHWMLAAALVLACIGHAHAQELAPEVKQQLAIAGAAVRKAINAQDVAALEKLWSPRMIVNSPNNHVLTRAEVLDALKRGQLDYEGGYKSTLEKIEFFGNIAVTMGEDTYTPNFGPEKGKFLHRRYTNVWQYTDGAWTMIARQATIYDPDAKHY